VASRRIYKYYRDLVQFRLTGDPQRLLRTINPREAALFDRATGIHVRFRLGGAAFPPTLYYKVFLLNPLCDVGSFAPRDYAAAKPAEPHLKHNKGNNPSSRAAPAVAAVHEQRTRLGQIRVGGSYFGTKVVGLGPEGTDNWYKRVERNGWRPVTQRMVADVAGKGQAPAAPHGAVPEEEQREEAGRMAFHYSRVKRREDKEEARRQKKRLWLAAMYKDGLAKERAPGAFGQPSKPPALISDESFSAPQTTDKLSSGARQRGGVREVPAVNDALAAALADPKLATTGVDRRDGDGGLGLDDIEDVLAWSAELDYEAYVANWSVLATSGTSGSDHHNPLQPSSGQLPPHRRAPARGPEPDWVALNDQLRR
jgi:hypothetical protein